MPEVPVEIQCFADTEKVCPIRAAVHSVEELHAIPLEERTSVDDYDAKLTEIAKPLSAIDKYRFYSILGTSLGRSILEVDSCAAGPTKNWVFAGKMVCNAETSYEEWAPAVQQTA